ncbi:MAG: DUF4199 domain-containing protein [Cytophagales bacterium]|nr:MAG: DUF4199 domain-containing protein [Cytophagales bacterium]
MTRKQSVSIVLVAFLIAFLLYNVFIAIVWQTSPNFFLAEWRTLDFFIYLLTVVITVYYARFVVNQGFISFSEGWLVSISTTTLLLMGSLFTLYIWTEYLAPDTLPDYKKTLIERINTMKKEEIIQTFGTEENSKAVVAALPELGVMGILLDEAKKKAVLILLFSVVIPALFRRKA